MSTSTARLSLLAAIKLRVRVCRAATLGILIFILVVFLPFLICLFRRFLGRGFGKLFTRLASKTEIGIEKKKKKRLTKRRTLGHFGVIAGHVGTTFFSTPLLRWASFMQGMCIWPSRVSCDYYYGRFLSRERQTSIRTVDYAHLHGPTAAVPHIIYPTGRKEGTSDNIYGGVDMAREVKRLIDLRSHRHVTYK
jgi:hypothetical protein